MHKCVAYKTRYKICSILSDHQRHCRSESFPVIFVEINAKHGLLSTRTHLHPLDNVDFTACEGLDVGSLNAPFCQLFMLLSFTAWSRE